MRRCDETVSGGVGMTNAISVKERLKKQAIEDGKTMQDKLVTYHNDNSFEQIWSKEIKGRIYIKINFLCIIQEKNYGILYFKMLSRS